MAKKKTEGKYPVHVTEDVFAEGNGILAGVLKTVTGSETPRVALVADSNVVQRTTGLGTKIGRYFQAHGITLAASPTVMQGGERSKSDYSQCAGRVAGALVDAKIGVKDAVIALGGGTLLDVASYAAAQARGGIPLVRIPTTAAAMIDGAFAEVAALDAPAVKDAYRIPALPAAVIVDPLFAKTVLDGVWRAGYGEAVRFAAVHAATLMRKLAKRAEAVRGRDYDAMRETIAECVEARGTEPTAPFALWCAGRLEAMSGYKLPHGYAVAIAICIDCAYAVKTGRMKEADQELVCRALADCGALDALSHSHHLLAKTESLLLGLDAWALATGSETIPLPGALGKSVEEQRPDRAVYTEVIADFLAVSRDSEGGVSQDE